jgi:hypothetical protein
VWVPNDSKLVVQAVNGEFCLVEKENGESGYIRSRNLSLSGRGLGIAKGVISDAIVSPDPEYVKGMKLYGVGIKNDPIGEVGSKRGKGVQHLTSSIWINALSEFVGSHLPQIKAWLSFAKNLGENEDYVFIVNTGSTLFSRAETGGLRGAKAVNNFLAATFLFMCAAEVGVSFSPFKKFSEAKKIEMRANLYAKFEGAKEYSEIEASDVLGEFATPTSRRDLVSFFKIFFFRLFL